MRMVSQLTIKRILDFLKSYPNGVTRNTILAQFIINNDELDNLIIMEKEIVLIENIIYHKIYF